MEFDDDSDFENPVDEFDYLVEAQANLAEEAVEYYCISSDVVICTLDDLQHRNIYVHIPCWEQWRYRQLATVVSYRSEGKSHLCLNTPFKACAACNLNIYYIDLASRCDTCCFLKNVDGL